MSNDKITKFDGETPEEAIEWLRETIKVVGMTFHPDNAHHEYEPPLPAHTDESINKVFEILGDPRIYEECLKIFDELPKRVLESENYPGADFVLQYPEGEIARLGDKWWLIIENKEYLNDNLDELVAKLQKWYKHS